MHRATSFILAAALAGIATSSGSAQSSPASDRQRCSALSKMDFTAIVGAVKVESAEHVAAMPSGSGGPGAQVAPFEVPAHCLVKGVIDQRTGAGGRTYGIKFSLALPDDWTGRFLLMGGGGLIGSVRPPYGPVAAGNLPALARGFAVVSQDSGHEGTVWDDSFRHDQRAALDFSESSVPNVTRVAREITAAYYGKPIAHSYMTGCSTGGREGMLAIERYPELFDGVIIGAPAMMTGTSNLATDRARVAFNQAAPLDAEGKPIVSQIFPADSRKVIQQGLLDQCDALDGLKDGVIENVAQCRFKPKKLVCKPGQKTGCLSAPQASALDQGFQPLLDASGRMLYPRWPYDTGIFAPMAIIPSGAPGPFGPTTRALSIDVDARMAQVRADAMQRQTDTNVWTNLSTFLGHGGKTIFYHGASDFFFSPYATWDWWARAAQDNGTAFTDASRFYMVPGMLHCSGGDSFDNFDLLSDLVNWVEQGKAPNRPIASRSDGSASRPLCQFPAHAQYVGGDPAKAESFQCQFAER